MRSYASLLLFIGALSPLAVLADEPNEYSLATYYDPTCDHSAYDTFDNNQAGDTKCHAMPQTSNGKPTTCVKAYSHDLCVYLYPEDDCKGQGSQVSSQWGICSGGNGTIFGGSNPSNKAMTWVPKSYLVTNGSVDAPGFPAPNPPDNNYAGNGGGWDFAGL